MLEIQPFNQPAPTLGNQYTDDRVLRGHLARVLPAEVLGAIEPELADLGELAGGELYRLQLADRLNEPVLTQWDAWGNRIDRIEVSGLWQQAEQLAAKYGLVATAYERRYGLYARLHQMALAYLFTPATDIYSCPLAMTDGAAATLLQSGNARLIERAVPRLTSRDPAHFWTSGQWMTESTGGSDVGLSETVACQENGGWRLYGRKWFTSAATSQMALTLARPEGNGPGGKGLALFYLETRDEQGQLQNIEIHRLKDKLGTRKVPTAELTLRGTPAELVLGQSDGVRNITPMLNITRTWNALSAVALMRRGLALAYDYAARRKAFGTALTEKPLHMDTLADQLAEFEGAFQLTFYIIELLGAAESGQISERQQKLLRILTPVAKLTTAKQAVNLTSEVLEAFGGAGYAEDTGLPALLRDSQVLPIWEGTTNVLALDTLRALGQEGFGILAETIQAWLAEVEPAMLAPAVRQVRTLLERTGSWLQLAQPLVLEANARRFALTMGRLTELALLLRHASWALQAWQDPVPALSARRLARTPIYLIVDLDEDEIRYLPYQNFDKNVDLYNNVIKSSY